MIFTNGVLSTALAANLLSAAPSFFSDQDGVASRLQVSWDHDSPIMRSAPGFPVLQTGSWTWDGVRLYGTSFKSASKIPGGVPHWFAGYFPNPQSNYDGMAFSAGFVLDPSQARETFSRNLRIGSWETPLPEPIYHLRDGGLESWWRLNLPGRGIYWLREQDGFWGEEQNQPLHLSAKALLYRENKVASASSGLEEIELTDLIDVSYLRSKLFRVLNCLGKPQSFKKCGTYARSTSGFYKYDFASVEYSEMVAYYSINRAMKWHMGIQSETQKQFFGEFGLKGPIDIFVRIADSQNAFYTDPPNALQSPNPYIVVGAGDEQDDGGGLRYLTKDSDVFIHEFAHHILFRSIKEKSFAKQGRVIQEGLADYFTYAITGNNLLGESVLDEGGSLRQGNRSDVLQESLFPPADDVAMYDLGSVLSSVIWSMRQSSPEWRDGYKRIDKVLWDSIDLVPARATLYQLACAMYITSGVFETAENLPANSVRTPMTDIFVQRNFFASNTPDAGANCPPISDALTAADAREGEESVLPPIETPRTPVTFTGESLPALPPTSGSIYLPLQPKRPFCGSVAARSKAPQATVLILLLPMGFIVSRLRRSCRFRRRSP